MAFDNIFSFDHYPTSRQTIERMLTGVTFQNKVVLEPSAGAGNIVDYLKEFGAKEVIACEINDNLRSMLSAKCQVIASDFLTVRSTDVSHVDLIVMNPPFSKEEKHIRHAYDIAPGGCEIISLCNASLISSRRYGEDAKYVNELIELYGYSENFGKCFTVAERPTEVEVGFIRIFKPKTGEQEFDGFLSNDDEYQDRETEGVMGYNYLRDLVNRYVEAVKQFDEVMEVSSRINSLSSTIGGCSIQFGAFTTDKRNNLQVNISREQYRKTLQKECWDHVFKHMDMKKYLTVKVKEQINRMVEIQANIPFTLKNVYLMIDAIQQTHGDRMQKTLVEAFEKICSYSSENSTAGEKWRTNSDYKINKKFIIPRICEEDKYMKYKTLHIDYSVADNFMDTIKALCYLSGINYDDIIPLDTFFNYHNHLIENGKFLNGYGTHSNENSIQSLYRTVEELNKTGRNVQIFNSKTDWGQKTEWAFFRVRGYKKGTMHFEFIDDSLLDRFNYEVAKAKGWQLPKQRTQPTPKQKTQEPGLILFQ